VVRVVLDLALSWACLGFGLALVFNWSCLGLGLVLVLVLTWLGLVQAVSSPVLHIYTLDVSISLWLFKKNTNAKIKYSSLRLLLNTNAKIKKTGEGMKK
jgi:hypothetical protein